MNSIMKSELDRVAEVAVSHGRDDPALDVFLTFVAALEPSPDAVTLKPAARRIGKLRLAQSLDRPGQSRLGACRLLTAATAEPPRPFTPPVPIDPVADIAEVEDEHEDFDDMGLDDVSGGSRSGTLTVERQAVGTARRLPELFDALVHAIRVALSLLA